MLHPRRVLLGLLTLSLGLLPGSPSFSDDALPVPTPIVHQPIDPDPPLNPVLIPQPELAIVFRATYHHAKGPCFRTEDGGYAMPMVDAFSVTHAPKGKLENYWIQLRPMSGKAPKYPNILTVGKSYLLRLNPSKQTIKHLQKNETDGDSLLWINGIELESAEGHP